MIQTKQGVSLKNLKKPILRALNAVSYILKESGYECVVTSTYDGKHKKNSLHYHGLAVDIRIRHIDYEERLTISHEICSKLKKLGPQYQLVLEQTHYHIEYDRRLNANSKTTSCTTDSTAS